MLNIALGVFVVAIVAALFGFVGIAAGAAAIAQIVFFIFLVLFLVSLFAGLLRGNKVVGLFNDEEPGIGDAFRDDLRFCRWRSGISAPASVTTVRSSSADKAVPVPVERVTPNSRRKPCAT